jgi:hypothetical protein
MTNLGVAQHLHPHPTIHTHPPSGGSTLTEPDLQRHPYTNKAKERVMPNSKLPPKNQKWANHNFLDQQIPIPPTTTIILQLPNYTASSQIKDTQTIVRIPSHPNINADPPSGGSKWKELDLQRHPYTNETKDRNMPN